MTASPFLAPFGPGIALRTLTLACRQILPLGPLVLAGGLVGAAPAVAQSGEATVGEARQASAAGVPMDAGAFSDMLGKLQARQQSMEEEIARLSEINRKLEDENQSLRGDLKTAQDASARVEGPDVEAQLEQTSRALRERETELASLQGQIARLEQVNRDAEAARTLLTVENAKFVAALAQEQARAEANENALREASARLEDQIQSQNALHAKALAAIEAGGSKLRGEKDALQSRLLEVQGKLAEIEGQIKAQGRSHADARKAADAAATQLKADKEELESNLAQAREKTADLEQRLKMLVETHAGAVAALERLQKDKSEIQGKLEAQHESTAELTDRLDQAERRAAALAQRAEQSEQVAAADKEAKEALLKELEQEKRMGAEERKTLQDRLSGVQAELGRTESETVAPAQPPVSAGGPAADGQFRQEAAEQLAKLRKLYKRRGGMKTEAWNQERDRLEAALSDRQALLAQSLGAGSVYRVRPDDTLAKISLEVYGKAGRWPEIFAANRHLLENPQRLVPGMVLVIP